MHLIGYIKTISKRRIINKLKDIKESPFYKELLIDNSNPLNKKQKFYLFLLNHNLFRILYFVLLYKAKKQK